MKILHINTNDISGGAAKAAYRLHRGLLESGVDSKYLVANKLSDDVTVFGPRNKLEKAMAKLRPCLDSLPFLRYSKRTDTPFSPAWIHTNTIQRANNSCSDLIHLHWIAGGFVRIESLAKAKYPLIWTLHDMWALTGGCHYNNGCELFRQSCGNCPQLNMGSRNDLSRSVLRRKQNIWSKFDITIATPSNWLAGCVKKSSLFSSCRIEVIHNGLDLNLFKPIDKTAARKIWDLPINKKLILFGALNAAKDHRKGFDLLYEGLKQLSIQWLDRAELIVFGASEPENPPVFDLPVHYLGHLYDDVSLATLYSAVDVMVVPSRQEAFGQTASESMACGTPVVAFGVTGLLDVVDHQVNGYHARPYDTSDLAVGIDWILADEERYKKLCFEAREKAVACFDVKKTAKRYLKLYEDILK